MKNKKKSLNPNKFWLYHSFLPKTQAINWNYGFNYKKANQITIFMENLNSRNFNLLIKKLKINKFKYQKYLPLHLFNKLYFIFIRLLITKFIKNTKFLQFLLFYLLYLKQYILVKKMNIRSIKAKLKKYKRKKRIKEHYLRAVPRYFKDFYLIKQKYLSFNNTDYYNLYCLSSINGENLHTSVNTNKVFFRYLMTNYHKYVKNRVFLNYFVINFLLNQLFLNKIKQLKIKIKIEQQIKHWIKQRTALIFYYFLNKMAFGQIQKLVYFYFWCLLVIAKQNTNSLLFVKILKYRYIRFWYKFYKKRQRSYTKLFNILKIVYFFVYKQCNFTLIKSSFFFFNLLLEDKNHWLILYNELIKTKLLKKGIYFKKKIIFVKLEKFFNPQALIIPDKKLIKWNIYQIKIKQMLYIQKYLENFFIKRLNMPILVRFLNLFVLHRKQKQFRQIFPLKKIQKSKKNKFFFEGVKAFLGSLYFNDPLIFAKYIAYRLQQTGRRQKHSKTINDIFYLLRLMRTVGIDVSGFQILLCGKVNANTQTQVKYLKWGPDLRTNTFSRPLQYIKTYAVTYTGVFGIHVWFIKK